MSYPIFSFLFRAFFTFLPFLIFSRHFSVDIYGVLTFYYTLFILTSSLCEFGFTFLGFKEASIKFCYRTQSNILFIKLFLSSIISVLVYLYAVITGLIEAYPFFILCFFISSGVFNSFGLHISAVFRGLEDFKSDFIYNALKSFFLFVSFVVIFFYSSFTLISIAISYFISTVLSLLYIYHRFSLLKFNQVNIKIYATLHEIKSEVVLFGIQTILIICYMQLDSQVVAYFLGTVEMSSYLDLTRIIMGGAMAGEVLVMRVTPKVIRDFTQNIKVSATNNTYSILFILTWIVLLLLVNYNVNPFVLIYGNRGSHLDLSYAFFILFIVYLRTITIIPSTLLSTSNNKIYRLTLLTLTLIISISLNAIFIPIYGLSAAFISLLIANIFLCFSYIIFMKWKWGVRSLGLLEYVTLIILFFSFYVSNN